MTTPRTDSLKELLSVSTWMRNRHLLYLTSGKINNKDAIKGYNEAISKFDNLRDIAESERQEADAYREGLSLNLDEAISKIEILTKALEFFVEKESSTTLKSSAWQRARKALAETRQLLGNSDEFNADGGDE